MTNKKIIIAPDSFKGSVSSVGAADAIKEGFEKEGFSNIVCVPMADGGEGTVEAMIAATGGKIIHLKAKGPMGEEVGAFYGIMGDNKTAVIEMAAASGLPLVKGGKNPLAATTYGTGQLMADASDKGCTKLILGIGGSATNDGGTGMARALGIRFLDENGKDLPEGGGALINLAQIDMSGFDTRFNSIDIEVACDVDNPLCGENGASAVYGPQKGATPGMVKQLDAALLNLAAVVKSDLGKEILSLPGSGAAGGLGGGLVAFASAKLKKGIDIIMDAAGMDALIKTADLVITGEGQTDFQTAFGKVPAGIASLCKKHGKPLVCISGGLGENYEALYDIGITSIFSICDRPMSLDYAMENACELLTNLSRSVARMWK
jgi:glycerate kinase